VKKTKNKIYNFKGITRIDNDKYRQHLWEVRLGWNGNKPIIRKTFSDFKYGGKEQALKAAMKFRDKENKIKPKKPFYKVNKSQYIKEYDLSGISRIDYKRTHLWWVRLFNGTGTIKKPIVQKGFSDFKYGGVENALLEAIKFRDEKIKLYPIKRMKQLIWKGRTKEIRREIQEKHGKETVKVGTGKEAAKKAYELGMSKVTCFKISTGIQDYVTVNSGGWRDAKYEYKPFVYEPTLEDEEKIRSMVNSFCSELSEVEKTQIVCECLMSLSLEGSIHNLKGKIMTWKKVVEKRKSHSNKLIFTNYLDADFYEKDSCYEIFS
jgi:hypothetical protein